MHGVEDVIRDEESLPAEDRITIIDSLLKTLNRTSSEVDEAWVKLARQRLAEIRSSKVKPISGKDVIAKIKERFRDCPQYVYRRSPHRQDLSLHRPAPP